MEFAESVVATLTAADFRQQHHFPMSLLKTVRPYLALCCGRAVVSSTDTSQIEEV
jgi:hypothetical protein